MENKILHSYEAEQAVLGGLLLENEAWATVKSKLSNDDFYEASHKIIFDALTDELSAGGACDVLTLSEKLKLDDKLISVGGEAYLFNLAHTIPKTSNIELYASVLKNRTKMRKVFEIAEELRNNADSADLDRIITSAQLKLSSVKKIVEPQKLVSYTMREFLAKEIKPRRILLSPWLPSSGLTMLYAKRGVGKTHVGLNIACALASGGEYLGWKADKPCMVLYLDGEMSESTMQERLASIVINQIQSGDDNFRIVTPDAQTGAMPDLSTTEGQEMVEPLIENVDVIIVDNISTLCRTNKENEAEGWRIVEGWALRMRSMGKSVLFIHHASKNGGQRGTSKREDVLDTVIVLKHPNDYNPKDGAKFEVHYEKTRGFSGRDAEPFLASLNIDESCKQTWRVETLECTTYQQVISLTQEGSTPKEIAQELGINKSTVSRHLKTAKQEGFLDAKL
jgi:hypothetical protein